MKILFLSIITIMSYSATFIFILGQLTPIVIHLSFVGLWYLILKDTYKNYKYRKWLKGLKK